MRSFSLFSRTLQKGCTNIVLNTLPEKLTCDYTLFSTVVTMIAFASGLLLENLNKVFHSKLLFAGFINMLINKEQNK